MAWSVGNTASSGALAGGTSNTLSLNNNKKDVFVAALIRDTRTAATATATYAGAAMTADKTNLYVDGDTTADLRLYIFRKTGAATGANNIVVTLNAAADFWAVIGLCAVSNIITGVPEVTQAGSADAAAATNPSLTFTTVTSRGLLIDAVYNKSATSMTANGQTIVAQVGVNGGSDKCLMGYAILGAAGSNTSTWTEPGIDDDWNMISAVYAAGIFANSIHVKQAINRSNTY